VNGEVYPEGKVRLEVSPGEPEDLAEGSREGQGDLAERVSRTQGKKETDHICRRDSVGP
jgi:hypothetical protein